MSNLLTFPAPTQQTAPPELSDAPARALALDPHQSFVVEAPAGSGKTGLLIQRLLTLLATVDDPAQILAITFTRKATAELADRVLYQLQSAHHDSPPTNPFDQQTRPLAQAVLLRDAQLAWNLLDQPHRLNIRTIDSVSADIAASLPILSGSGGALSPTEDAADLYAEAARRTLAHLGGQPGGPNPRLEAALETILLHRDANLAHCESLIASMLASRDQWGELVPLTQPHLDDRFLDTQVLPRLEKALDLAICRALTTLTQLLPEPLLQQLCELAAEMGHLEGYKGSPSPIAVCAGKFTSPEEKSAHLDHWRALIGLLLTKNGDFRRHRGITTKNVAFLIEESHRDQLTRLIDQVRHDDQLREILCGIRTLPPATYPPSQWRLTKALFHVLSHALTELQLVFAERSRCDFTEIALLAKAALREDSALEDLAASAAAPLQHLLVDEMQDTSSTQYELLQLLTQHWDGHSQTLFLVGDPKQSIYLFRQARVERFVHTMRTSALGSSAHPTGPDPIPLTPLSLTANFRSQRTLVEAFNLDFPLIFPPQPNASHSDQAPDLIPYHPAAATRPPTPDATVTWHANPLPSTRNATESKALRRQQSVADATEIRTLIEQWRARPLPPNRSAPWKIAILVHARNHLLPILQVLKQSSPIPYRAIKIEPLAERQEILDLLALTRALLHPADRTAWLALLRTPWVGLTLADLHLLAGADDHSFAQRTLLELIQQRAGLLSEDAITRLQPFQRILSEAPRASLSLPRLVHHTWQALNAPAYTSPEALLNIEQYFTLLDSLAQDSLDTTTLDLDLLTRRLKKLYAAPSLHPDAVDLMTIHNAKGLEWDLVLVPSLERPGRPDDTRLLNWLEIDPGNQLTDASVAHGILAPIKTKGGAASDLYKWMCSIQSAREAAERKRLFYVACTRAREQLHLFAAPERKANGSLAPGARNLLAAAWPAAEQHFAQAPTPILQMPAPTPYPLLDLAAAAAPPTRLIQRIPSLPAPTLAPTPDLLNSQPDPQPFHRPEGSFAARATGNTLHALLDLLARQIAAGTPNDLPTWLPRITTLLRAAGLAPSEIPPLAQNILRALTRTLASPEGQWLLAPHPQAASEIALASDSGTLRLDRTFLAGPTPLSRGNTHLWIVDYKTSSHAETNLEAWLDQQRESYRGQLETYARALSQPNPSLPLRLALFFPLLPRLLWWDL